LNPDVALFHLINNGVGAFPVIDGLARLVVNDYFVPTLSTLAAVWVWFSGVTEDERLRNQRAVILVILAILISQAFIKDLSYVYFRPRPFATETVKLLFYRPSVSSFPSVPIAGVFAFAAGFHRVNPRLGNVLYGLGTLYGLARVYAGVHYPLDIIGGAIIGAGTVLIVERVRFIFNPLADKMIRLARRMSFG
jgi:undecaprenyl-diphosphatase